MLRFFLFCLAYSLFIAPAWSDETSEKVEKCAAEWKLFMTKITDEEARAVCQCVEDEKKRHPLDAEKGSKLTGPGGLDNAGPWPNILHYCLYGNPRETAPTTAPDM